MCVRVEFAAGQSSRGLGARHAKTIALSRPWLCYWRIPIYRYVYIHVYGIGIEGRRRAEPSLGARARGERVCARLRPSSIIQPNARRCRVPFLASGIHPSASSAPLQRGCGRAGPCYTMNARSRSGQICYRCIAARAALIDQAASARIMSEPS